jgi:Acetyltransferase (GNAT) domain
MRSRIVNVRDLDSGQLDQWKALLFGALNPYPFLDPRVVVPYLTLVPAAQDVRLVLVEDDEELLALMTFAPRRISKGRSPRGVTTENAFLDKESTWSHPLILADRPVDAFEALFRALRTLGLPRLVEFRTIPAGGTFEEALTEAASRLGIPLLERERREFARAAEVSPAAPADTAEPSFLFSTASAHTRSKVGRAKRALETELGHELRVEDRSGDPEAITRFIELQSSGWKGDATRGGGGIRVMGYEKWFEQLTNLYRTDGDLRVFALTAGNHVVHMNVMLCIGDTAFGYADVYDERFARFRPGALGRTAEINHVLREPRLHFFEPNLSPQYVEASRLFPDRATRVKILAANGGLFSRTVVRGLPHAQRLRRRITRPERPTDDSE